MGITQFMKPGGNLPLWYHIGHLGADSVGQGTWALTATGTPKYAFWFGNDFATSADGDNFTQSVWLPSGTYTFMFDYWQGTAMPILDVYVDGVEVGSVDLYGTTDYTKQKSITGIVLGQGKHLIKFQIDGKNASSSAYAVRLLGAKWTRTALVGGVPTNPEPFGCISPITFIPFFTNQCSVVQGTFSPLFTSAFLYSMRATQSTSDANGDGFTWKQEMAPGTWTVRSWCQTQSNAGKVDLSINGVVKTTIDLYTSGVLYGFLENSGIVISYPAVNTMGLVCNGKNASSGGYIWEFSGLLFKRTA